MPEATRSGLGMAAMSAGLLLPLAYGPAFTSPSWTPKAAILLVVTGLGLGLLPRLIRDHDARRPALAGVGFLAAAALSTALSRNPTLAFWGPYGSGTGLLFVAALMAAWALGASITESDRRGLATALLSGALVNAVLALCQAAFDLSSFGLGLFDSRSAGFMGNPVHLAGLLTGALGLAASRLPQRPVWLALPIVVLAGGLQSSGSRIAVALAGALVVALALRWRSRLSLLLIVLVGLGLTLGSAAGKVQGAQSGSTRLVDGVGEDSAKARLYTWGDAADAIRERPVVGAGPGRYLTATTPHRSLHLARVGGGDSYFRDAHNFVVEYAVTTGLLGLVALLAFLALAWRRARGPLAWFASGILLVGLVQPLFVATTPLAFLALGAARHQANERTRMPAGAAPGVLAGAALASLLLTGDGGVENNRLDGNPTALLAAARRLPPWPEPASLGGKLYIVEARVDDSNPRFRLAERWHRVAVDRDSDDPRWLNDLGAVDLAARHTDDARRAFSRALGRAPYSVGALTGLARTELADNNPAGAGRWLVLAVRVAGPTRQIETLFSESRDIAAVIK